MHDLRIAPDGEIMFIYNDDLAGLLTLGQAEISRASHVEPEPAGGWAADMSPVAGPKLTGFTLRSEALAAEVEWLNREVINTDDVK